MDDDVVVAHQTIQRLEKVGPANYFDENDDDDDDDDDDMDDFDPSTQIFDPLSFWTERTGRFPRNK